MEIFSNSIGRSRIHKGCRLAERRANSVALNLKSTNSVPLNFKSTIRLALNLRSTNHLALGLKSTNRLLDSRLLLRTLLDKVPKS